ncbi:Maf family protein [Nannocystaceae bacterium ST9]
MTRPPLVLASASPRRSELLRSAGLSFRVLPVDCDERWHAGETPLAYVLRVAADKATLAAERLAGEDAGADAGADSLVIAADTTVWLREDREPLGKPADRGEARAMLRSLTSGTPHRASTACVLVRIGGAAIEPVIETAEVHMRRLDDAAFERFIGPYLDAGEWSDRAGGYAIQGLAAGLVERIVGSYTAIVGLPLAQVLARLDEVWT